MSDPPEEEEGSLAIWDNGKGEGGPQRFARPIREWMRLVAGSWEVAPEEPPEPGLPAK
jgi:hypothetical protein